MGAAEGFVAAEEDSAAVEASAADRIMAGAGTIVPLIIMAVGITVRFSAAAGIIVRTMAVAAVVWAA